MMRFHLFLRTVGIRTVGLSENLSPSGSHCMHKINIGPSITGMRESFGLLFESSNLNVITTNF